MAKSRLDLTNELVDDDINNIIQLAIQNNRSELNAWLSPFLVDFYSKFSNAELEEYHKAQLGG